MGWWSGRLLVDFWWVWWFWVFLVESWLVDFWWVLWFWLVCGGSLGGLVDFWWRVSGRFCGSGVFLVEFWIV
jgi:hypothetical protein